MAKTTKKKWSCPLLESTPSGTKMYLAVYTRTKDRAWVGEVIYKGFSHSTYSYYSTDNGSLHPCAPFKITEDIFTAKFSIDGAQAPIKFQDNNVVGGKRSWDAPEHEACNIGTSYPFYDSSWGINDCYLTADKELFNKFLKEEKILNTAISRLEAERKSIDNALANLKRLMYTA